MEVLDRCILPCCVVPVEEISSYHTHPPNGSTKWPSWSCQGDDWSTYVFATDGGSWHVVRWAELAIQSVPVIKRYNNRKIQQPSPSLGGFWPVIDGSSQRQEVRQERRLQRRFGATKRSDSNPQVQRQIGEVNHQVEEKETLTPKGHSIPRSSDISLHPYLQIWWHWHKWIFFCLEKVLFWGLTFKNRGDWCSRNIHSHSYFPLRKRPWREIPGTPSSGGLPFPKPCPIWNPMKYGRV